MTDKQIIIDGVDVSGCTRYCADNGKCTAFKSQYLCSERNNCYTKRILKKNKTINILKEKLLRKEQECERLKEYFETAKEASNCNLKALGEMTEWADKLDEENDQLKQTLTEIKEIIHFNKTNRLSGGADISIEQILQKISECEVE